MKTNVYRLALSFLMLLFTSKMLWAQDEYGFYLQKAQQRLAEGDCDGAQKCYNIYKELTTKTDSQLERQLADCILSKEPRRHDFVDTIGNVCFSMVYVEGGTDTLGRTSSQNANDSKIAKPHVVTLSGYYIGKYEVTFAEFEVFIKETGYVTDAEEEGWAYLWMKEDDKWDDKKVDGLNWRYGPDGIERTANERNHPVLYVSWNDAIAYCEWLKSKTGKNYCLPTEAQWEFAARGGKRSKGYKYAGGNDKDIYGDLNTLFLLGGRSGNVVGWWGDYWVGDKTHPIGLKSPNELGIYDMSGNAQEWCDDWYGNIDEDFHINPSGPTGGYYKVVHGGSWCESSECCQVAHRHKYIPSNRRGDLGFRIAISDLSGLDDTSDINVYQIERCNSGDSIIDSVDLTFNVNGVFFVMKPVEGGTFLMGAQKDNPNGKNYDSDAYDDQMPIHRVTVSSFYMGETEVTQALWQAVMGTSVNQQKPNKSALIAGEGPDYPMYYVSWNECRSFINKLNQLTGESFRLPTEAEWEYAVRGGVYSCKYKYSGSNNIADVAWYTDTEHVALQSDGSIHSTESGTKPVKSKVPNELGLYDMSGNVFEWCNDRFGSYSGDPQTNPQGASKGDNYVIRGGCWCMPAKLCVVSLRAQAGPADGSGVNFVGFRLALSK